MRDHYKRFHLWIKRKRDAKPKRTTVSIHSIVADLLALKLNQKLETPEATRAITKWLDKSLSTWQAYDPELPISQQASFLAIQAIADPKLLKKLNEEFELGKIVIHERMSAKPTM